MRSTGMQAGDPEQGDLHVHGQVDGVKHVDDDLEAVGGPCVSARRLSAVPSPCSSVRGLSSRMKRRV